MSYVNYEFYSTHYKNPIPEDDFTRLSFRADMFIDNLTFRRLRSGLPSDEYDADRVRMAVCEVVRYSYMLEQAEEKANAAASGTSTTTGAMAGTTGVITSKSSGISSPKVPNSTPSDIFTGSSKVVMISILPCRAW